MKRISRFTTVVVALAVFAFAGVAVSACTSASGPVTPKVSKTELQDKVANTVKDSGVEPDSVICADDLVGEVGNSTQCEIEGPGANFLAPIVTVTSVQDSVVKWDLDPALSKNQLERSIAKQHPGGAVDWVRCESGLEGKESSRTHCDVAVGGVTVRRTVRVTGVENLEIRWRMLAVLPRAEIEKSLLDEFARQFGERPEAARCSGDLQGAEGSTVECTVIQGAASSDLRLTTASVSGEQIHYRYEPIN